jgi:uncharacterized protein GlcG (DUF336 family)
MPQHLTTRKTLTFAGADAVLRAAMAEAENMGRPMVIAVTDEAGNLLAFCRMDGAPMLSIDVAQNKAWTAVSFGLPTHQWHDFIKDDPPLAAGVPTLPRLVIFGGGYPLMADGHMVGAIGVSGGHYSEDQKVAEAGIAALA